MQHTDLIYMTYMNLLSCGAKVKEVLEENDRTVIILDRTVFYPQGGGQPYDTGVITASTGTFKVDEVRFIDGTVKHLGAFESGRLNIGDVVTCEVDADRRLLMSRLHSAGHVLDMAVHSLGYDWQPGKGYHFPNGPYVEYNGSLDLESVNVIATRIEQKANSFIHNSTPTRIEFMPKEAMSAVCRYVPEHLPEGKPARVVFYGDYGVPCGGTHVANLAAIKHMTIRKVKLEKGTIRVSYMLDEASEG